MKIIIATFLICGVLQPESAVSSPVPGKAVTEETKIKLFQFPQGVGGIPGGVGGMPGGMPGMPSMPGMPGMPGGNMCPPGTKPTQCPPGIPPGTAICCCLDGVGGGGQFPQIPGGQFPFPGK